MQARLCKFAVWLKEHQLDGMLITRPENRQYLSGFSGSAGMLLLTAGEKKLITDFRYIEQAEQQAPAYEILRQIGPEGHENLLQLLQQLQIKSLGFESDYMTWDEHLRLAAILPPSVILKPAAPDKLRKVKDEAELQAIQKAVEIADQALSQTLATIKPGISEQAVAAELEYNMRRLGSERPAFDTIIASGLRSALPHGKASDKIIAQGDFVTIDFGAVYQGYHSDITRTFVVGKASTRQKEIYELVLSAQLSGVQAVQAGLSGRDVDSVARKLITDAGYGENFGHGLGHGVGLAIHEEPRLSPTATLLLAENMVVTVEPGIYIPGWGGVRIEDTVVVSAQGSKVLTASTKQLLELL